MTLGFRLTLKRLRDGRLIFSVPVFYRALLAAIGLLILLSMILTAPEGDTRLFAPANTVPLIICFLSFLGAAYHERWLFNAPQDSVTHQYGLLFAHSNRRYRISQMSRIQLEQFTKGHLPGPLPGDLSGRSPAAAGIPPRRGFFFRVSQVLTLTLHDKDGTVHRLETYTASQRPKMLDAARAIADYCRLPLLSAEGDRTEGS
jgi:hypothetical protein